MGVIENTGSNAPYPTVPQHCTTVICPVRKIVRRQMKPTRTSRFHVCAYENANAKSTVANRPSARIRFVGAVVPRDALRNMGFEAHGLSKSGVRRVGVRVVVMT